MYSFTKKKVHGLLHPEIVGDKHWDKIINVFIIVLIILNVIAVIVETVASIHTKYKSFFDYFDLVSAIIFTIEYVMRVWSSNHEEKYKHSVWGRLKYMLSPGAIIDLVAILPFFLLLFFGLGIDLREVRMLRLLRVLRLFRLTAYTKSASIILNVFKKRMNELMLSFVLAIFLIIISSCIIYFAEHLHPENKERFTSIPATLWWSVVTLTTTGYGDMVPMTDIGKLMAGVIMLIGVAFFAIPAGIITAGFLEESRKTRKAKLQNCPHCGKPIEHDDHYDEH
ncbi:MAG: ion transporter [Chitinophagaceae bacterium]